MGLGSTLNPEPLQKTNKYVSFMFMKVNCLIRVLRALGRRGIWALSGRAIGRLLDEPPDQLSVSLARMCRAGHLERLAGGYYRNPLAELPRNHLEQLANWLRPDDWFYLSLECVLHEAGQLSQIPNRLTFVTSGRRYTYRTPLGSIEFTHSGRDPATWLGQVTEDWQRGIHVASPELALADLERVGRNLDLVHKEGAI